MHLDSVLEAQSKHARYNASESGKERRKRYRKNSGKFTTSAKYLSKPFIAVDGKSYRKSDGTEVYFYLALSTGESIYREEGLGTLEILRFLSRHLPESSEATPVIYGGGVDFNHWIADLKESELRYLYDSTFRDKPVSFGAYEIRWQRSHSFSIRSGGGKLVTINDVSGFFQSGLVPALKEWLPESPLVNSIEKHRKPSGYSLDERERAITCNTAETEALVILCTMLREYLDAHGLRPRRWQGPGNSVVTLFRRHDVKSAMDKEIPEKVAKAARFAYAGGRIEVVRFGSVTDKPSYQYDINSAYPHAMTLLPKLSGGSWEYFEGDPGEHPFALYKVSFDAKGSVLPSPVFIRGNLGSISYPIHGGNWIWSPEMEALRAWSNSGHGSFNVVEAWTFTPDSERKPFAFIADLYEERQELKRLGDPAEDAIKKVLNSIYGKLAQQLGFLEARGRRAEEIPPYHQLEWAGYVTSFTRAQMLKASLLNPAAIIAFETDALFSSEPLDLPLSSSLGEWKESSFERLTYVQSGVYAGNKSSGESVVKTRGFDLSSVNEKLLIEALGKSPEKRFVGANELSFIGLGLAVSYPTMENWRKTIPARRLLRCEPTGKRVHAACPCGDYDDFGISLGFWHTTICPIREDRVSREYPVQWINPDPEMLRLAKLRAAVNEWD